jgi:hypothetical protein
MVSVLLLAEFVATLPEVREQLTRIAKWFMEEGSAFLPLLLKCKRPKHILTFFN